jgi:hypothetical protein
MIYQIHSQYGLGFYLYRYFYCAKIFVLGLKSIDLRLNHYTRSDGFLQILVL